MDAVDEVKSRLSIDEVVADYVELKRAGRNFKAKSPWTNEKTASLMISPEKQIWHDFSSGRGGNMFSFVMAIEGVEFREALEILARKAGIDLTQYDKRPSGATQQKEVLYQMMNIAASYYQATLLKNDSALEYVTKKRKLNRESIQNFLIGYAPTNESALVQFLTKRGYSQADIKAAGLGVQRRIFGDMFRGRMMISLCDPQGKVIGFTARQIIDQPDSPKYINTPQTILYDKGRHVFGLHLAKDAIRTSGYVVIVEGNLDVISSHQVGVRQVVATAGTAMTENHIKALSRLTSDIRLAYDRDRAGVAATERAISVAQGLGVQLSIIDIPSGKDPDDLIKQDMALWQQAISNPAYAMDWLFERYKDLLDISTALGKREFTTTLLKVVAKLTDSVEQDHYIVKLAESIDVAEDAVRAKLEEILNKKDTPMKAKKAAVAANLEPEQHAYEDNFLALLLAYPITRRGLETSVEEITLHGERRQLIHEYIMNSTSETIDGDLPENLNLYEDYVKMLLFKAEQLYEELDASERLREVHDLIRRVKEEDKKQKTKGLTKAIKDAEERGDKKALDELLGLFNQIIKDR